MSSTVVMTIATPSLPAQPPSSTSCPGCGYNLPSFEHAHTDLVDARATIHNLEEQVRILNDKATAAVDRWADYEDELTRLRAQLAQPHQQQQQGQLPGQQLHQQQGQLQPQQLQPQPTTPPTPSANPRVSFLQSGTSRLSALLSPRKSTPDLRTIDTSGHGAHRNASNLIPPPSPSNEDLMEALTREQGLRKEAETQVATTSREIEELSAALFEQANEMVADERRARARLEERVGELERRDVEKRRRLEKLEGAMTRIERVRLLLAEEVEVHIYSEEEGEGHGDKQEHDDEEEDLHKDLHKDNNDHKDSEDNRDSEDRKDSEDEKEKQKMKEWDHVEKPSEPAAA
ncbi:hypothetical protein B0J13DRAFT_548112 [Dactylonectria estremocensis]|uniref:GDP/GTP exchange factor Sec2 N-terminal domain-containing protein n=1 Tax=Dactylonectria estremocensis TaxID=1079267 RepID=A0A9P9J7H9_9HYPO|nr:hypothetical protein B0J13DRAFT_548112 [Dactylonectria estremocensis]